MRTALSALVLVVVCPLWVAAQNLPAMRGPWLGMLFDPGSGSLRPLRGLPGAATLGPALALPAPLDRVRAAQRGGFALGLNRADGAVVEVTAFGTRKLAGVAPSPDEIVFSPSGTRAALYYSAAGTVQVLSGFPSAPARSASLDFSMLPGALAALAVSDDGLVLAACSTGADSAVVYAAARMRPAAPVFTARSVAALGFLGASRDALMADASAGLIYRLRDASAVIVAGAGEGVSRPIALASTEDGRRAVIVNSGGAPLVVLDLTGGPARTVACSCHTALAEPLAGNAVFRLTAPGASRLWLLDAERAEPRLFFVPQAELQ
ncbi:MAG TPA: hypothetical protein VHA11_08300 [Bryobacteraceae bacterium]|nr:hypothetical protein [Bryobacteraceae bacterium]